MRWSALGMNLWCMGCCRIVLKNHPDYLDKLSPGKEDSLGNCVLANDIDYLDPPVSCKVNDSIQQYSLVCVRHELVVQGVTSCK